jgi:hypothetical protein
VKFLVIRSPDKKKVVNIIRRLDLGNY